MRDATIEFEKVLEYCKAILTAETEEEIMEIKEEIANTLREENMTEEAVLNYIQNLEEAVEKIETQGFIIDENGRIIVNETSTQAVAETEQTQLTNTNSINNTNGTVSVGLCAAALIACMTLKKTVLKNKQGRKL